MELAALKGRTISDVRGKDAYGWIRGPTFGSGVFGQLAAHASKVHRYSLQISFFLNKHPTKNVDLIFAPYTVRHINADKPKYLQYFIDRRRGQHPGIDELTVDDFRPSRLQMVDPVPIPQEELERTYEWMRSWHIIDELSPDVLVDIHRQQAAHGIAAE